MMSSLQALAIGTSRPHKLLVFGFDAVEAALRHRIRACQECSFDVTSFSMRRRNMTQGAEPFWRNVDLSETRNAAVAYSGLGQ